MSLHLLTVLFHLGRSLQLHRLKEGRLNDPCHYLMIVTYIQLIEGFIDAMLQVAIQKLLHRFYNLVKRDVLVFINRERLQKPPSFERVKLVSNQLSYYLELYGILFNASICSTERSFLTCIALMLHSLDKVVLYVLHLSQFNGIDGALSVNNLIHDTADLKFVAIDGLFPTLLLLNLGFQCAAIILLHEDMLFKLFYRGSLVLVHQEALFYKADEVVGNLHIFKMLKVEDNLIRIIVRKPARYQEVQNYTKRPYVSFSSDQLRCCVVHDLRRDENSIYTRDFFMQLWMC